MPTRGLRRTCCHGMLVLVAGAWSLVASADSDLISLAGAGRVEPLKQLLKTGADANTRQNDGSTALHQAVLNDQPAAVAALLAGGADPALANRNGVTPLYLAVQNGSVAIVDSLLKAGADPNAATESGETLLMTAAYTGKADVAERLIVSGALVDARDADFRQTALMIAVREGQRDVAALLIRYGADVNARTRAGPAPPYIPPCKGTGCGSEGVGINRSGVPHRGERHEAKGGMTPLLYAAREGRTAEAHLLLDNGAAVELTEANGIPPLLMAVLNDQLGVANLLLDYGANFNTDDFWGRTPLFAAVDYRNLDLNSKRENDPKDNGVDRDAILPLIQRLLDAGANVNARTKEWQPEKKWLYALNDVSWVDMTGQTPFIRAAAAGDVPVMKLLLKYKADPAITTYEGTTALMAAAGVNWTVAQTYTVSEDALLEAVKLTLDLGADVNARNSMGLTPLLGATNRGANPVIKYLVEKGAKLDVKDAVGRTALRWAEGVFLAAVGAQQKPETMALLKELMDQKGIKHE